MAPEIYFHFRSYNSFGGERNLSLIAGLLERTSVDVGISLRVFEVTAWFATNRPPKKTLETLYLDFNQRLTQLPAVKSHAKKAKLTIDFRSEIGTVEEVLRKNSVNYSLFVAAFDELERVVFQLQPVLRKKKELQPEQLFQWVRACRSAAPSSQEELEAFEESEKQRKAEERAAKSPWELLGIDWEDYHPSARQVLDDPFYWELANDLAPNGNDTGADLLHDVREAPAAPRDPLTFLNATFVRWGMAAQIRAALQKPPEAWNEQDEIAVATYNEAAIALPFALVKYYGQAGPDAVQVALEAIQHQRVAAPIRGWNQSPDHAVALAKTESKLRELLAG